MLFRSLSLQSSLSLCHPRVIGLLLSLLLGALGLCFGKLRLFLGPHGLVPSPHGNILSPLCLGQLLLQINNPLLSNLKLLLGL